MSWLKRESLMKGGRSSKSALHGLIHWLSQAYCSKGITVNGVAPALIQDTKMLPGSNEELAKSEWSQTQSCADIIETDVARNPNGCTRAARRDC